MPHIAAESSWIELCFLQHFARGKATCFWPLQQKTAFLTCPEELGLHSPWDEGQMLVGAELAGHLSVCPAASTLPASPGLPHLPSDAGPSVLSLQLPQHGLPCDETQ